MQKVADYSDVAGMFAVRAKELLADGTVQCVAGWKKGLFDYDVTPGLFRSAAEIDADFVYDRFCAANLSKYLVRLTRRLAAANQPAAENPPVVAVGERILVFLKQCDRYSFNQLVKEHRIDAGRVEIVDAPCSGMCGSDGSLLERCLHCESCTSETQSVATAASDTRYDAVARIEAMTVDERYDFWQREFSRCIRCNACRDVCPACTCEKCVFDNSSLFTSQKVAENSFEESLYHIIRAWHVAGRCTDCGECSRVCPEHIPLHLLNRKFLKDMNEFYGPYLAGRDMESVPPMLAFSPDDPEAD